MILSLLAHLHEEPYKPLYFLSTKTKNKEIEVDKTMEVFLGEVIITDDGPTRFNKDHLIRRKRDDFQILKDEFFLIYED